MNDLCEFGDRGRGVTGRGPVPFSNGAAPSSRSIIISFCKEKFRVPQCVYSAASRLRNGIPKPSHPPMSTPGGRLVTQARSTARTRPPCRAPHQRRHPQREQNPRGPPPPAGLLGTRSLPEARGPAVRDGTRTAEELANPSPRSSLGGGRGEFKCSFTEAIYVFYREKKKPTTATGSRDCQIKIGSCGTQTLVPPEPIITHLCKGAIGGLSEPTKAGASHHF